jgi:hypothetical protein
MSVARSIVEEVSPDMSAVWSENMYKYLDVERRYPGIGLTRLDIFVV